MKLATLVLAFAVSAVPLASLAQAQTGTTDDEQVLLQRYATNKRDVYSEYLTLTDTEGNAFWPVYDQYEADLKKLDERFVALINDYAASYDTLTDAKAASLLKERLEIDRERVDLRSKYCERVAKVLPGRKALRFAQIDARIRNAQLRNIYSIIPLAR